MRGGLDFIAVREMEAQRKAERIAAAKLPKRKCLHCRREFKPEHKGLFICPLCKKSEVYRGGVMG